MSHYWDSLADRSAGLHTADDFEAVAYRLVAEQVLYYSDIHSRSAYWTVESYEREFRNVLAPLGVALAVNRKFQYAIALPRHAKAGSASIAQTILALVLRMIYDTEARIGQLTENGEVFCDLIDLEIKYKELSGRDLPSKGKLESLLDVMRRWGIARLTYENVPASSGDFSENGQPFAVIIRPAIADILSEASLKRLAQFKAEMPAEDTDSSDDKDVEEA